VPGIVVTCMRIKRTGFKKKYFILLKSFIG